MADLDKNNFAPLEKSLGKEAYTKMFTDFNKYYDSRRDFIVLLSKELSYMPGGININPPGMPYRKFAHYYFKPQDGSKVRAIAKEFHDLYASKGSKRPYRVYRSGFGESQDYLMVVVAAKDAADYEKTRAESNELIGDEGKALYSKFLKVLSGVKYVSGMVLDDLSCSPGK